MKGLEQGRGSDSQEAETSRRSQQGDADAFEQLYRLNCSRVFALCLRMLRHTAEAAELTQQRFRTVFRAIGTFRGQCAFSSWLHRVTMSWVLMHLRKKIAHQVSLEEIMQTGAKSGTTRKEKAIAQMPARLKGTLELCDLWGHEHGEVAKILAYTAGTSKSRLHKARRRLGELWPKYQPSTTQQEGRSICEPAL